MTRMNAIPKRTRLDRIPQPPLPLRVEPMTEQEETFARDSFTHELFVQQLHGTIALARVERQAARAALETPRASRQRRPRSGRRGSGSNSRRASR
jgi:hypothetical protein